MGNAPERLSGQEIWFDETYSGVIFTSKEQWDRFQQLKVRTVHSAHFINAYVLTKMGIHDALRDFLIACGLGN